MVLLMPPPVHGTTIMNKYVSMLTKFNNKFDIKLFPLHYTKTNIEIGKLSIKKIVLHIFYFIKLFFILVKFRPSLIYFTIAPKGSAFYRDFTFVLLFKLFNIKIIYHLHGKGIKKNANNFINFSLYKFCFKDSYITILSRLLLVDIDIFAKMSRKIYYLPNGIPISVDDYSFNKIISARTKNKSVPKVLFFSNMKIQKGILILLEAINILNKKDVKFFVNFVGNWDNEFDKQQFLYYIDKYKLKNLCKYHGPAYAEDKVKFFSEADIFVFPTFYEKETFGLVNLEAMQFGLPIISTYEGAIPEIIDDNETGFLVKQRDSDDLAEKIQHLISNKKERIEMGLKARHKFLNNYEISIFYNRINDIFNDII